jgi:hypothetical protein
MAKHTALWIVGGLAALYVLGRSGAASAAGMGAGYSPAYGAGASPAGGGFFTGLQNMIQNLGAGLPGLPSGAGQYNPVNYSPAATAAPTATGGLIPANYTTAAPTAGGSPYSGILAGTTPASTLSA